MLCAVDVSVCAFARPERRFAGAGASKCHGASTCLIVHVSVWVVVHDSHGSAIPLITTAAWKGDYLSLLLFVTEKRSQVDKPHQQI